MAPFGNVVVSVGFRLPGMTTADGHPLVAQSYRAVITPGYAEALGMRLLKGRLFRETDISAAILPMLVNASFAQRYFTDGKGVIGRQFIGVFDSKDTVTQVVGVVADVLPSILNAVPQPQIYTLQRPTTKTSNATLVVKTDDDPSRVAPILRQLVQQFDPRASLDQVGSLRSKTSASVSEPRFTALVMAAFSVLALTLAATGLYGVLSYTVAQRQREIGLRSVLGATRGRLIAMVLREGLGVTALGLVLGLAIATLAMREMANVLFGVSPFDIVAFTLAPLVLGAVACAACLLPAWRAATTNPVSALNAE
jgi:ABC-type antimicrobial peptide transport system permease subunit